jgi:hypothetical protein
MDLETFLVSLFVLVDDGISDVRPHTDPGALNSRRHGSSVAAVGIEQSRTEQETRSEQSRFFGLNEQDLLTGQDQSELSN